MSNTSIHRLRTALPYVLLPLACAIAMHLLAVDDARATITHQAGPQVTAAAAPGPEAPAGPTSGKR